ncbi:MAG: hypothetical protein IJZ00_12130 [Lachnospiraceae bacterium]|nr:hypothetical protein [Lachnospiraceae bacterium]MBQ8263018.1 hypothetical protein [Lachnospiraceae bacterium]
MTMTRIILGFVIGIVFGLLFALGSVLQGLANSNTVGKHAADAEEFLQGDKIHFH